MNVHTAYWVIVVLGVIPMPLLLVTWLGWFSPPVLVSAVRLFLLIAATGSYVWVVLAMKFPLFLAESYSTSRFAIIDVNFVVMVVCSIAAFRGKERRKDLLGFACILTALVWSVVGAVNVVV
jgi:hypothetical protein